MDQVVASHGCTGLSPHGVAQAEALRNRLARTGELADAVAVHTSLMRRAAQTAEIIAPALGGLTPQPDCGFCEQHHGEGDGLPWHEYESRFGGFDPFLERDRTTAPGAESVAALVARAGAALRDLMRADAEKVVVVAHGGVVGVALEVFLDVPFGGITRYVENTSITEFAQDKETGRWSLVRLNDAVHLYDI